MPSPCVSNCPLSTSCIHLNASSSWTVPIHTPHVCHISLMKTAAAMLTHVVHQRDRWFSTLLNNVWVCINQRVSHRVNMLPHPLSHCDSLLPRPLSQCDSLQPRPSVIATVCCQAPSVIATACCHAPSVTATACCHTPSPS